MNKFFLFFFSLYILNFSCYSQPLPSDSTNVNSSNKQELTTSKTSDTSFILIIVSGITGIVGMLGTAFAWFYNEWQKRNVKRIIEKESRYILLISYIRSFGDKSFNNDKTNQFIVELQKCWMYCPDHVILAGNEFILAMKKEKSQEEIDICKGNFALAMRNDLRVSNRLIKHKRKLTKLKNEDFLDVSYSYTPDNQGATSF